jgi:hypothetical protein
VRLNPIACDVFPLFLQWKWDETSYREKKNQLPEKGNRKELKILNSTGV